jgi:pilus assembly protein Flp/PilA
MFKLLRKFRRNQSGATAIEYGLIVALISIVGIGAWQSIGTKMTNQFTKSEAAIPDTQ